MTTQTKKPIILVTMFALFLSSVSVASSEPPAGATQKREIDGATMVYVPSGEFLMGSSWGEGNSNEWPQHTVYVDGFWIDRTEVTNRQFERFVKATGYHTEAENEGVGGVFSDAAGSVMVVAGADWQHPEGPKSSIDGRLDEPVTQIAWGDAVAYCQWAEARLPTEAEWEKAARGTDGRRYPWGKIDPTCQTVALRFCRHEWKPSPVGSQPDGVSPYGGLDMLGNVGEWASDLYARDYDHSPGGRNPSGPDSGMDRVIRGGWWINNPSDMRSAMRYVLTAGFRANTSGFRCTVTPATSAVAQSSVPMITSETSTDVHTIPAQIGQNDYTFELDGEQLHYLLFLPKDYENDPQKKWPLILFLHHEGYKGDTIDKLWKVRATGVAGMVELKPDFPAIVLSPQLPTHSLNWYAALDLVDALLDQIVTNYRVDVMRMSVTGLSQGAEGVWLMVTRKNPERFAAAVPVGGAYSYYLDKKNACLPEHVAFWVFHGAQDTYIPVSEAENLVNALKACGIQVQYSVIPDAAHSIGRVYNDQALYDWLLLQRK